MNKSKHSMIKTLLILGLSLLLFCSCANLKKENLSQNERLFPNGVYSQSVNLEINMKNNKKSNFPFRSVSKIQNENFELLGLTPFGTKAFEATGKTTDPDSIEIKFYIEKPPFLKDAFIKKTLSTIQKIQTLKRSELSRSNGYDSLRSDEFLLEIYTYSTENIPETLRFRTSQWKANIKLLSFKAL